MIKGFYLWLMLEEILVVLNFSFAIVEITHLILTETTPVLGKVVEGLEVIDLIKEGDKINTITIT